MVIAGTLGGIIDDRVSFHYDFSADVLYLRLLDRADAPGVGEDIEDGLVLFRDEATDEVVGLDAISWWKRFGGDRPCDSLREIHERVEPLARRLVAEAQADRRSDRSLAT